MPSPRISPSLGFLSFLLVAGAVFVFTIFQFFVRSNKPEPVAPRDMPVAVTTTNPEPTPPTATSTTTHERVSALTEYSAVATSSTPFIYFSEEVQEIYGNNRVWPTVTVFEKRGSEAAKALFQVGKVGDYSKKIRLSPDKQFLLVDIESKLQRYTFATGKLEDLFIPQRSIGGVDFSPDGQELFVWDQKYAPQDKDYRYFAHRINLATGRDVVVATGSIVESMIDPRWLPNDTVILHAAMGEVALPWKLSLKTGDFGRVKEGLASGAMSPSGRLMTQPTKFIDDVCNDFWGGVESAFDLVESDTGNKVASIDGRGRAVSFYEFSPDDRRALYAIYTPFKDRELCEGSVPKEEAYLLTIATGKSERVNNPQALMSSWNNVVNRRVRFNFDSEKLTYTILLDDEPLVESKHTLVLIGDR